MGKVAEAPDRPPYRAWLVVFLANLPFPLYFAVFLTAKRGRIGMVVAIVLCWYLGHRICKKTGVSACPSSPEVSSLRYLNSSRSCK